MYKKKNKFSAVRQTYKGYSYDSKMEANYAMKLDLLLKAGEIKEITKQKRIELYVNDVHVANNYVDFLLEFPDGSLELHEVKGFPTPEWKLKRKILEAQLEDIGKRQFNGVTPKYIVITK